LTLNDLNESDIGARKRDREDQGAVTNSARLSHRLARADLSNFPGGTR